MTPEQYRKIRDGLDARPTLRQLASSATIGFRPCRSSATRYCWSS